MDYTFLNSQPQQLQYNGMPENNVQSMYGIPDSSINADSELFRGLNSIGSHFDAFSPFSPQDQFATPPQSSALPAQNQQLQHQQVQQHQQPLQAPKSLSPESTHDDSTAMQGFENGVNGQMSNNNQLTNGMLADLGVDKQHMEPARASSEENDPNSVPAQDRRKAQNRAAQRAFRERKERHVKDLEAKLQSLSSASNNLQSDNERLKRELAALSTQNEILRATHVRPHSPALSTPNTSSFRHQKQQQQQQMQMPRPPSPTLGPQSFTPTDFIVATGGEANLPLKFDAYPNARGRMLLAGAAWDHIVRDRRVHMGQVDLEEVCRRLKGTAVCDGRGPAFREEDIRRILDECSVRGNNDDLL